MSTGGREAEGTAAGDGVTAASPPEFCAARESTTARTTATMMRTRTTADAMPMRM